MIRVALFDLGETLIHAGKPFPGAVQALEAIAKLPTAAGRPLALGLVSDYTMPAPPASDEAVAKLEAEYEAILKKAGLDAFFAPFSAKVTLSTRAGVRKPARKVFELAAARTGPDAKLTECVYLTEDDGHLKKCREYGMAVLRFGTGPGVEPAFGDWKDAPAAVAAILKAGQ